MSKRKKKRKSIFLYLVIGVLCLLFLVNLVLASLTFGTLYFDPPLLGTLLWLGMNIAWILIFLYFATKDSISD